MRRVVPSLALVLLAVLIGLGPRPAFAEAVARSADAPAVFDNYNFCVASVRELFAKAAALALAAAKAETSSPVPPVVSVPGVSAPPVQAAPEEPASDHVTVFVAKKIITMDPGWPEATAVAVQNGRILSVGSLDDLKPWLDKYPHDIDNRFAGKVIYPGFIEPHGHPLIGAIALSRPPLTFFPLANPYGPPFPGVKSKDEAVAKLKEYVAQAKSPTDTVIAWGYDIVAMGGHLDRAFLDQITKTQPLMVWDASEHFVYANSAAIEKFGITPGVVAKTLGAGKLPNGESNGQFLGVLAAEAILLKPLQDLLAPDQALKIMKYLADLGQQAGITTTGDLMFGGINLELEQALAKTFFDRPDAIERVVPVVDGATFAKLYGDQAQQKALDLKASSNDRIIFNGVKFFSDDAFVSLGMEVQNPGYIHSDQYKGLFLFTSFPAFVQAMEPWWNAGFHIHVHSNGNAGNQATIDALAELQAEHPRFDHRFTIEHYGISTPEQARELKALGGIVSTNPYYLYARSDLNIGQFGTDRASLASRIGTLVREGVVVSLHADTPVAPPRPLEEVWIAVNRVGALSGQVRAPYERVTVDQALRMITIDAAYTLGVDDEVGSIEAGKLADFTVLDADPRDVEPMAIKDIPVTATILGGRVILTADTRKP
ncbi:amidohydrolase [Methyloceanibacter sp.]|uniref:amidohydrolase n=1 Tax=Methyloceanibacter sp. TaxID=1965321 RepID=UPI002D3587B7|nr:amidohydrolase [Methyloceanibacter sp.]HZP08098.1 amidohydrolase [Methyloceanibacter sp.]